MDKQKYYFITVFSSYDNRGIHGVRCWGFYTTFEEADEVLRNNYTDLWEYSYTYGIIEEYYAGISGYNFERWLYKYDRESGKYYPIGIPKELKHYASFAIG